MCVLAGESERDMYERDRECRNEQRVESDVVFNTE